MPLREQDVGGAFVGVRDVWLEALHASAWLKVASTSTRSLVRELGAPEGDGSGAGAVLSVHLGAVRVWGDKGSRLPTMNVRKGASIQLRARVLLELSYAQNHAARRRPHAANAPSAHGTAVDEAGNASPEAPRAPLGCP